jgi:hypothetical protein
LRPGGTLVVRDHDVDSAEMDHFVVLAHVVFNLGLGLPWSENVKERRHFRPVTTWVERLAGAGFRDTGARLLQAGDPTQNTLMAFVREGDT